VFPRFVYSECNNRILQGGNFLAAFLAHLPMCLLAFDVAVVVGIVGLTGAALQQVASFLSSQFTHFFVRVLANGVLEMALVRRLKIYSTE